jgi:DMSO/TMAO reductase YedYZ molybdopterin-dependent catalytic subunit
MDPRRALPARSEERPRVSRRQFLSPLALAPLWRSAAAWAPLSDQPGDAQITEASLSFLGTLLTPSAEFFIRDHFAVPQLPAAWKLQMTGRVRLPFEISEADIQRQPGRTLTVTVECAGNGVGSGGVSTADWTGIPLRTLLERAGLGRGVKVIRLVGADRGTDAPSSPPVSFIRSIPVEKALHPDTLLAYQMNGAPLSAEHGHPVRAIVPGWYGMDSVKWLTRVEALDREDTSYFMSQRYLAVRLELVGSEQHTVTGIRVKSLIVEPRAGATLTPGPSMVRGAAWAGENRVARVEVSLNGGSDWAPATLDKDVRPYSWVLWSYPWKVPASGAYTIVARATDDRGNTQPISRDPLRLDNYELNWCHAVRCEVR